MRLVCEDKKSKHHVISLTDEGVFEDKLRDCGVTLTCLNMPRKTDFTRSNQII